jgi:hypothetical protein
LELLLTGNPLGINMNIELEEVVVLDVSDEALEQAAGGPQAAGGKSRGCAFSISTRC